MEIRADIKEFVEAFKRAEAQVREYSEKLKEVEARVSYLERRTQTQQPKYRTTWYGARVRTNPPRPY